MSRARYASKELIIRCCSCQKIYHESGEWLDLEPQQHDRRETLFSHSVCPECMKILYPDLLPLAETEKTHQV